MITPVVQRWRDRRGSYRPAGETIRTAAYEVTPIDERTAKGFVVRHHYSGTYPAARLRFGLFRRDVLVGALVFSHPIRESVLDGLPGERLERAELGRVVLLDDVPANGESWFLARAFELARDAGLVSVLSLSDPVARTDAGGAIVFPGHIGTIYQATNASYLGRASMRTLRLLPDGRVLSARAIAKLRAGERGWRYAAEQLRAIGAPALEPRDSRLLDVLRRFTRTLRHAGNHRYAFGLDRRARRHLPASLPYPKFDRRAA